MAVAVSPTDYVPRQSFPMDVVAGFSKLDTVDGVVATWWDYGYISALFFNGLPTFHDGGSQTTPVTHFVARSSARRKADNQCGNSEASFRRRHGGMSRYTSRFKADIDEAFEDAKDIIGPDIFVVATGQMAGWMGSISTIGNWDIETGKPIAAQQHGRTETDYRRLNCRLKDYPRALNCQGVEIDLQRGLLGGRPLLIGWTHTKDGAILRRRDFDHAADHAIQITQDNGPPDRLSTSPPAL